MPENASKHGHKCSNGEAERTEQTIQGLAQAKGISWSKRVASQVVIGIFFGLVGRVTRNTLAICRPSLKKRCRWSAKARHGLPGKACSSLRSFDFSAIFLGSGVVEK